MNNVDFVVLFIAYCVLLVVSGFGSFIMAALGWNVSTRKRQSGISNSSCPFKEGRGRCVQDLVKCYESATHVVYRKDFPND